MNDRVIRMKKRIRCTFDVTGAFSAFEPCQIDIILPVFMFCVCITKDPYCVLVCVHASLSLLSLKMSMVFCKACRNLQCNFDMLHL